MFKISTFNNNIRYTSNKLGRMVYTPPLLLLHRNLFIQTQTTPNENALKFIPSGVTILPNKQTSTVEITNIKDAIHKSELALKLLSLNDKAISSILFGFDFITIVKYGNNGNENGKNDKNINPQDWNILKPQIFAMLTEHITMGQPIFSKEFFKYLENQSKENEMNGSSLSSSSSNNEFDEDLTPEEEVVALIKELLTTRIQPAIQEDGGDIQFINFNHNNGIVYLKLIGACKSCSSSEITLKSGIEDMLKYYIDEVKSVEQVLDEPSSDDKFTAPNDIINNDSKFGKHTVDELPPSL
jgi:Fe-S cluster biogenesis protein NfuA